MKIDSKTILIVAVAVIGTLYLRTCDITHIFRGNRTKDTISVKSDTVFIQVKHDTLYHPFPVTVTNTHTIYKPLYKTDTIETTEVSPADTAAILRRFYETAFYSDVQKTKYGNVTIQDTVTQNRIKSRRLITDFTIPEVTNTVTLNQKKLVAYFGASAMGSPITPLYAAGVDFSLKMKTDKIYTVGGYFTKDGLIYYQAGFKLPIHLRRK